MLYLYPQNKLNFTFYISCDILYKNVPKGGRSVKRVDWIDATRYIAIFHVVFIHTLDKFWPELLNYWVTPPISYIPLLLNAKVAVLFFCVLLGFFAAKPRQFNAKAFALYALKRYIQFSFFLLICSVIYTVGAYAATWIFHAPDEFAFRVICDDLKYNIIYVLRDAFLFEDTYNPTMWSMQQFFIASILCYILGCIFYKAKPAVSFIITAFAAAAFLVPGSEYLSWIAFCIMGAFARLYVENIDSFPYMEKRGVRIVAFILAWFLYKFPMPECTFVFFLMGIASILLIAVCFGAENVQEFLSHPPLPKLGRIAFGVYVVHTPINSLLHSSLQPIIARLLPVSLTTLICFIITISLATLCAWILDALYGRFIKLIFSQKVSV